MGVVQAAKALMEELAQCAGANGAAGITLGHYRHACT